MHMPKRQTFSRKCNKIRKCSSISVEYLVSTFWSIVPNKTPLTLPTGLTAYTNPAKAVLPPFATRFTN